MHGTRIILLNEFSCFCSPASWVTSRDRLGVRKLRCGRSNPGSNPSLGSFLLTKFFQLIQLPPFKWTWTFEKLNHSEEKRGKGILWKILKAFRATCLSEHIIFVWIFSIIKTHTLYRSAGKVSTTFKADSKRNLVSALAKIFPSPDWNVGVDRINLCDGNCTWKKAVIRKLYPWDAG